MAAHITGPIPIASPLSSLTTDDDYPLVGETLGLWRLFRGIGRGGMGEVYEAEYDFVHLLTLQYTPKERVLVRKELEQLPRSEQARMASELLGSQMDDQSRFAIKVCTARVGTAAHKRFLQEADWAKKLGTHPYIVSVHNIHAGLQDKDSDMSRLPLNKGKHSDVAYMVMDIAVRRYSSTRMSIKNAVHMIRCVASALDHAHASGIIHRDLKPENILGDEEHPLLTDFGIAKEIDHGLGLTRTGQIIGTLDYMSPEQATDAKHVDKRTDIYSLGVVLYEFATGGCLPYFHFTERESCLAAIRSPRTEPRWPRQYVPGFPKSLEWIILRAMAHKPDERYQSMSDFIADLDRYARGDWISFIGRIHPRRLFNYAKKSHPYWLWGVPASICLMLLLWGGFIVYGNMDGVKKEIESGLAVLNTAGKSIIERSDNRQLFNRSEELIAQKLRDLFAANPDKYSGLRVAFDDIMSSVDKKRFLSIKFDDKDASAEKERLKVVTHSAGGDWVLIDEVGRSGLMVNAAEEWNLSPFGEGYVYCFFKGYVFPGFQMHLSEASRPSHQVWIEYNQGKISLLSQEDEMEPQVLDVQRVADNGCAIKCALFVSQNELIFYWPGSTRRFNQMGLRPDSPARIRFQIPRNVVLEQLHIGNKKPH